MNTLKNIFFPIATHSKHHLHTPPTSYHLAFQSPLSPTLLSTHVPMLLTLISCRKPFFIPLDTAYIVQ